MSAVEPSEPPTDTLSAFAPALADAIVDLLHAHGLPTAVASQPDSDDLVVLVAPSRRTEAFRLISANMEQLVRAQRPTPDTKLTMSPAREWSQPPQDTIGAGHVDNQRPARPLLFERFRSIRFLLAVILAPLLLLTLARPGFPLRWAVLVLIGGVVVIVALAQRPRGNDRD